MGDTRRSLDGWESVESFEYEPRHRLYYRISTDQLSYSPHSSEQEDKCFDGEDDKTSKGVGNESISETSSDTETVDQESVSSLHSCHRLTAGSDYPPTQRLNFLYQLYQQQQMIDLILRHDEGEIRLHKMALAQHSNKFLNDCRREKTPGIKTIQVHCCPAEVIAAVVNYLYTHEINLDDNNVDSVFSCASQIGVEALCGQCRKFLRRCDTRTAIRHLDAIITSPANAEDGGIKEGLLKIITHNFSSLIHSTDLLYVSVETLCAILSSDQLCVEREVDVFEAAVLWLNASHPRRELHAVRVLQCVRFSLMLPGELASRVEPHANLIRIPEIKQLLFDAYRYQALFLSKSSLGDIRILEPQPRHTSLPHLSPLKIHTSPERKTKCPSLNKETPVISDGFGSTNYLMVTGGWSPGNPLERASSFYRLNLTKGNSEWQRLSDLPSPRCYHKMITHRGCIYVLGGSRPNTDASLTVTASVYMYNIYNQDAHWIEAEQMMDARMYFACTVIKDKIYVVGGVGLQNRILNTVEVYNVSTKNWEMATELSTARVGVAACPYKGKLFVVGGCTWEQNNLRFLSCVECFDPSTRSWTVFNTLPSPKDGLCYSALTEVSGHLLLLGGATKGTPLQSTNTVYQWDPVKDSWFQRSSLEIPRHDMSAVTFGDCIFLVGGLQSGKGPVLQIEQYNVTNSSYKAIKVPYSANGLAASALQTGNI